MNELDKLRNELDKIDQKMKELFIARMKIVEKISAYKRTNNVPIFDKLREDQMIKRLTSGLTDSMKENYLVFLNVILTISKDSQK